MPPHHPLFRVEYPDTGIFVIDSSEKELFVAVIIRAIHDFMLPTTDILQRNADYWLRDRKSFHVGSLMWILDNISTDSYVAFSCLQKFLRDEAALLLLKENSRIRRVLL